MTPIYYDVTELFANPLRTGIQRLMRETIRHWPGPAPLIPFVFSPSENSIYELPSDVFSILTSQTLTHSDSYEVEGKALAQYLEQKKIIKYFDEITILNSELFFGKNRSQFYIDLSRTNKNIFWILMDFLPYLQPQYFPSGTTVHCMHFIRAAREIPHVAFISETTRDEYTTKIIRDDTVTGPIFIPGGDGLGLERQVFSAEKTLFTIVGTIEPRKRVAYALEGFDELWKQGSSVELAVAGRMMPFAGKEKKLLDRLGRQPRLHHLGEITDDQLKTLLRRTRAMLFVSEAEGFGIPIYEALHVGIPVICSAHGIPSLSLIPPFGQIRLDEVSAQSIAGAVEEMAFDTVAARFWDETTQVKIPLWNDFASGVARWIQAH